MARAKTWEPTWTRWAGATCSSQPTLMRWCRWTESAREFNNSIELNNSIGGAGGKGAVTPGNHGGELPRGIEIERVRSSARRSSCDDTRTLDATVTGSGYNPLTQDFANTKFFLS